MCPPVPVPEPYAVPAALAAVTRKDVLQLLRSIPRIGQKLALYAMRGEWSFQDILFTPGCSRLPLHPYRARGRARPCPPAPLIFPDGGSRKKTGAAACAHLQGQGLCPGGERPHASPWCGPLELETGPLIPSSNKTPSFTGIIRQDLWSSWAEKDDRPLPSLQPCPKAPGRTFEERFRNAS